LNAAGVAVRELTADDATIEWQVHLSYPRLKSKPRKRVWV
jgi:hypothetical protein